jgi:DNA topoisomerase-1
MILVNFKDKMFIGCTTRCGYTQPVPAGKTVAISAKVCPECGWKLLHVSDKEKGTWDICINRSCSNNGKKMNEKKKKELN